MHAARQSLLSKKTEKSKEKVYENIHSKNISAIKQSDFLRVDYCSGRLRGWLMWATTASALQLQQ